MKASAPHVANCVATEPWCGDATSVIEFLRPIRAQLDAPGVLEVCVNRPGEMLVETEDGWRALAAPELSLERCLSLAMAVATFSDQQVNQERPLLAATLPTTDDSVAPSRSGFAMSTHSHANFWHSAG